MSQYALVTRQARKNCNVGPLLVKVTCQIKPPPVIYGCHEYPSYHAIFCDSIPGEHRLVCQSNWAWSQIMVGGKCEREEGRGGYALNKDGLKWAP